MLVVDVLYVGMDVLTALTIERAGFGIDHAISLADVRRWLARKRYRVVAVDVLGDAVPRPPRPPLRIPAYTGANFS